MKFSAATVTYGNRVDYLKVVVNELINQGFCSVFVYSNGVNDDLIKKFAFDINNDKLIIIKNEKNIGSAGGYNELLNYIKNSDDSDFILLVDDDNLISKNFMCEVRKISFGDKEIYYFDRPDRSMPRKAVDLGNPFYIIGDESGFLGRSIFNRNFNKKTCGGDLIAAPYGGLIIPRGALLTGIMPDKDLYLYADDYDYTYRLTSFANYKIIFSKNASIIDLEKSFHLRENKINKLLNNRFISANKNQIFYSVRNQTYMGLRDSSSLLVFLINVAVFFPQYILQFLLSGNFSRAKTFTFGVLAGFQFFFRKRKSATD